MSTYREEGFACFFFSFTPPHKLWRPSSCPCIPVFAWEYGTIPNEGWGGNHNNDWTQVLRECGQAVTLSTYAMNVTRDAIGSDFNVVSAPSPLWDSMQEPVTPMQSLQPHQAVSFEFSGHVLECPTAGTTPTNAEPVTTDTISGKPASKHSLTLQGVIYTSVFNPADGRKNWRDLVHAFCFAFRENPDATLIMKLAHHDVAFAMTEVFNQVERIPDRACRVILLHGYLDKTEYAKLVAVSHYVVNSSYGEGQCLPLTEFMACGRPAIAPLHTAMTDYLDEASGFPFKSSKEWTHWPHDYRAMKRTYRYRIDWEDMVRALRDSHVLARSDWTRYLAMGENARQRIKTHCSQQTVQLTLGDFLRKVQQDWEGRERQLQTATHGGITGFLKSIIRRFQRR